MAQLHVTRRKVQWIPPAINWFKFNSAGNHRWDSILGAFISSHAVVIRDSIGRGQIVHALTRRCAGVYDAFIEELRGIELVAIFIRDNPVWWNRNIIVITDCQRAVEVVTSVRALNHVPQDAEGEESQLDVRITAWVPVAQKLIADINMILRNIGNPNFHIMWHEKERNMVVDALAKGYSTERNIGRYSLLHPTNPEVQLALSLEMVVHSTDTIF